MRCRTSPTSTAFVAALSGDAPVAQTGQMERQILLIGADNFAFPIPLKKNAGGQWYFDTVAGKDEILTPPHWPE